MTKPEIDRLIELVQFDYEHTLSFIDGVVRVSTSIRTIATAGWFGLIAAAVQADQPLLALLAAAGVAVLGLQDAYHGWLYAEARGRASEMEGMLDDYYKCVQRGDSAGGLEEDLIKELHNHRIGQRSNTLRLRPAEEGDQAAPGGQEPKPAYERAWRWTAGSWAAFIRLLTEPRPKFFYRCLYLPLIIAALLVTVLIDADGGAEQAPRPLRVCIACGPRIQGPPAPAEGSPAPRKRVPGKEVPRQGHR